MPFYVMEQTLSPLFGDSTYIQLNHIEKINEDTHHYPRHICAVNHVFWGNDIWVNQYDQKIEFWI